MTFACDTSSVPLSVQIAHGVKTGLPTIHEVQRGSGLPAARHRAALAVARRPGFPFPSTAYRGAHP